jgi:hypothetical protein
MTQIKWLFKLYAKPILLTIDASYWTFLIFFGSCLVGFTYLLTFLLGDYENSAIVLLVHITALLLAPILAALMALALTRPTRA